jgi:hypothetical protein
LTAPTATTTTKDTDTATTTPLIPAPRPGSRVARARMPLATDVVAEAAVSYGVCIRPVAMKTTDTTTGEVAFVDVPCGATLADKCPSCAERARRLRMAQCREGWHLDTDPLPDRDAPNDTQVGLITERADITAARDDSLAAGDDATAAACAESIAEVDADIRTAGVRGEVERPATTRRTRSTRRRQDAPELPKRDMENTTVGRAFTGRDGTVFRPSMFLTVTLDSYGRVHSDGTPLDPGTYDYTRAARDALTFSRLLDRLVQNLRRVAGYDVQYFAAVEPQRRLAPHAHFAIRGTIPRALLRQVVAATYHQVWWPTTGDPVYSPKRAPVWVSDTDGTGTPGYVDPDTRRPLATWDQALDELDNEDARPRHVARFGAQVDVQGLLARTPQADRRIGYLAKYLTKSMTDAHDGGDDERRRAHVDRLHTALQLEPCSPRCPNWLRYGIAPQGAHDGQAPGSCRSKAHKRAHLGYAGRRILVSRKWSGKTLADHRHDRRAWVLSTLGVDPDDTADRAEGTNDKTRDRFVWELARPDDPVAPLPTRLLRAIAERQRWRAAYEAARDGLGPPAANTSWTANGPNSATATQGEDAA